MEANHEKTKSNLSRLGIGALTRGDIANHHGSILTDNTSLVCSNNFFNGADGETNQWTAIKKGITDSVESAGNLSAYHLIQNLVLYEQLIVDGVVLANDESSLGVAKLFPEFIKPLNLTYDERHGIGSAVDSTAEYLRRTFSDDVKGEQCRAALQINLAELILPESDKY